MKDLLKKVKAMFRPDDAAAAPGHAAPSKPAHDRKTPPRISISKEKINTLPIFKYGGRIHVIRHDAQVAAAVKELRREHVLGFDIETRPAFRKGESYPPALVQLAGASVVYVFQLLSLRDLKWFHEIFSNAGIVKAGVSLAHDIKKLRERQEFQAAGFVELSELSDRAGIQNNGLRGLAAILLGIRISKGAQRSNWSRPDLSREQIVYAATDAYICREIYLRLARRE